MCRTGGRWLWFVDLLYLPDSLRGSGVDSDPPAGRGRDAPPGAVSAGRGCVSGFVYTISFHAPDFYKQPGWIEFGRISGEPGISRISLSKDLRGIAG